MTPEQLHVTAAEHFYWFHEAAKAFDEMNTIAFDMSQSGSEAFAKAKEKFEFARARCKAEFEIMKPHLENPDAV